MTVTLSTRSAVAGTQNRLRHVEGLRAIAVIMVMVFHAGLPMAGGFTGVDVFFVISGFVITALLAREMQATGSVDLKRFYSRRAKRLLPALSVVLLVTGLLAAFWLPLEAQTIGGSTGAAAALFMANFEIMRVTGGYFDAAAESNPLLHTWSLAVEEQFYLIFPALLIFGWVWLGKRWGHRRGAIAVVGAVLASSFALSLLFSSGHALAGVGSPLKMAFYSSPTRAWEFGVGAILALLALRTAGGDSGDKAALRWWALAAWTGAGLLAFSAFFLHGGPGFPGLHALAPVLGTALLIAAAGRGTSLVGRVLQSGPMVRIGELSYSLYLWHWPVLVLGIGLLHRMGVEGADSLWVSTLLIVVSVIPAWLSYRFVESPIRGAASIRGLRVPALAGVCITTTLAVSLFVHHGGSTAWGDSDLQRWEEQRLELSVGRANGCHVETASDPWTPVEDCTFGEGDRATIYLVGDSHANALSDSIVAAAEAGGYRVIVRSASGCPALHNAEQWQFRAGTENTDVCAETNQRRFAEIESIQPDLVVVANRSPYYVNPTVKSIDELGANPPCPVISKGLGCESNAQLSAVWGQSLETTIGSLDSLGVSTLVVGTVPEHRLPLSDCSVRGGVDYGCATGEASFSAERRQSVVQAEQAAVARSERATYFDPFATFCDENDCRRDFQGAPTYRDDDHVSPGAAILLSQPLNAAIVNALDAS